MSKKTKESVPGYSTQISRGDEPTMMQELANSAIETAKRRGASYADVRVMDIRHRDISTKNGEVGTLAESESLGIGIRVLVAGAWGFASADRVPAGGGDACAAG